MMFLVEREPAPAVGVLCCRQRRDRGSSAYMYNLHRRRKQNPSAPGANRGAEIDVLGIYEVALVDQAHRFRIRAPDQQTRAADPVGRTRPARHLLHDARHEPQSPRLALNEDFLPELVEGADHAPKGQFGAAVAIDEPRTHDRHLGMPLQLLHQSIDGMWRHDGVAVQEQQVCPGARANADIGCAGEPQVGSSLDQAHVLVATCCAGAAVGGRVVDDDDLVRNRRRRSMKRPEAALEVVARIEADDDDRDSYQTWITYEK